MFNIRRFSLTVAVASLMGLAPLMTAHAQESSDEKQCVDAKNIGNYQVVSDELVRLEMVGQKDVLMRLKRHCPQLYYHKYMSFTPVNGKLCARFDDVITRSGTPCRIESFSEVSDTTPGEDG